MPDIFYVKLSDYKLDDAFKTELVAKIFTYYYTTLSDKGQSFSSSDLYGNSITVYNAPYSFNVNSNSPSFDPTVVMATKIDLKVIYAPTIGNRIKNSLSNPQDAKVTLFHEGLHLRNKIYTNDDKDLEGVQKHLDVYLAEVSSEYYPSTSTNNKSLTNHNIRVLLGRIKEYSPANWIALVNDWKEKFKKVGYDIW